MLNTKVYVGTDSSHLSLFFPFANGLYGLSFCSLQLHFLSKWSFDDDDATTMPHRGLH